MKKILVDSCYSCPYVILSDLIRCHICIAAWNDDETGKKEGDFQIKNMNPIQPFCPLEDVDD